MNFSTPTYVLNTIRAGDTVEWKRGINRAKITQSANGAPPLSPEIAKKLQIHINVNFGELASLLSHARRQYYNSFLRSNNFFRVTLPDAPEKNRAEWERTITEEINKPLKKSERFFCLHQYRWTDVVVHGVATVLWEDAECWLPRFVAREDLRIPTDTETDFHNLEWFGVRYLYTVGELIQKVWYSDDKGWNKKMIASILKNYKNVNYDSPWTYLDWETQAERMAELVKQNLGYYESDAVPKIPLYTFYFRDTDREWYRRVVPDSPAIRGVSEPPDEFLYTSDEPLCRDLRQLMQCQFGDLSFKTPFMFHSVRSLGFELLEPTYYTNLTRCRFLQHVHDNFNKWVQINDPGDKQRAQSIDFTGPTVRVPQGVHVLTQAERHQINPDMVEMAMAQLKQLMQEASATYTQETDTGTRKEQTAFETGVKVQQVNAMLAGLILVANTRETYLDEEIARRLCLHGSSDDDAKEFQRRVINKYGIPRKWLDPDNMRIEVEQPLGAGNPTMEQVEAQKAIELRPMANPTAQGEMLHAAFTTFFGAKRAARWAPVGAEGRVTDAQVQAQNDFASLMWGIPVQFRVELNPQDQIDVLLRSLALVIKRTKAGGLASPNELAGMGSVIQHIQTLIQILSANPQERHRVRIYGQQLGRLVNEVKGLGQRLQQMQQKAAQQNGQGNGEGLAKSRAAMMDSITKNQIAQRESQQKMALANAEFQGSERRQNLKTANDIVRSRMKSMEQ